MKPGIFILFVLFFGLKCSQNIEGLENGNYKIIYDKEFSVYSNFEFSIKEDTLIIKNYKSSRLFLIEKISKTQFRIESLVKKSDSLTKVEKQLNSMGIPFYDIVSSKKDTLDFIYRHNLHVTINSGKIIRLN